MLSLLALIAADPAQACDPAPSTDAQLYPAWGAQDIPLDARLRVHLGVDRLDPEAEPGLILQDANGVPVDGELVVEGGSLAADAFVYLSFLPAEPLAADQEYELIVVGERLDSDDPELSRPSSSIFMTGASSEARPLLPDEYLTGWERVDEDPCFGDLSVVRLNAFGEGLSGSALHFSAVDEELLPAESLGVWMFDAEDPEITLHLGVEETCFAVQAEAADGGMGEVQIHCEDELMYDDFVCGTGMFWGCSSTPASGAPFGLLAVLAGLVGFARRRRS